MACEFKLKWERSGGVSGVMGQEVHPYLGINLKRINLDQMAHRHPPHKGSICEARAALSAWSYDSLVRQCADGSSIYQASHTDGLVVYASTSQHVVSAAQAPFEESRVQTLDFRQTGILIGYLESNVVNIAAAVARASHIVHDGVRRGIGTTADPATGPPAAAVPVSRSSAAPHSLQASVVGHAAMHSFRSVHSLARWKDNAFVYIDSCCWHDVCSPRSLS